MRWSPGEKIKSKVCKKLLDYERVPYTFDQALPFSFDFLEREEEGVNFIMTVSVQVFQMFQ